MTTGRRRPLAAAAWVLTLGLLAGCSGDPARPPVPAQTTTPTVSATTAPPAPTVTPPPLLLPAAATTQDQSGAEAFFRHFWAVYTWSYSTGEWTVLKGISTAECQFCESVVDDLRSAQAKSLTNNGGAVTVLVAVAQFAQLREEFTVAGMIDQAVATQTDPSGRVVWSGGGIKDRRVNGYVTFVDGAWRMNGLEVLKETP